MRQDDMRHVGVEQDRGAVPRAGGEVRNPPVITTFDQNRCYCCMLYAVCCMLLLRGLDVCMLASKTQQYTERCGRSLRNRVPGISADLLRTMYRFLLGSRQA